MRISPGTTRRQWLASIGAPALLQQPRSSRPNVIVILLDDLGCGDLGYLGATGLATPNIDSLAGKAAVFSNWYSNAPVCAPARAAILSGRFPARAGVPSNGGKLTPGLPTFGSLFRQAGYATAAVGKWHLGDDDATCPNAHGFDSFYGFHSGCIDFYSHRFYWGEPRRPNFHDLYRNRTEIFEDGRYFTERITEEAVAFIRNSAGRPFAGYFAYNAPHYPMHAPQQYIKRFAHLPQERQTYAAMIAAVDDGVGAIRAALAGTGQLDNTMIFFLGDNGATTEKRAGLREQYATAGSNGAFRGFKFSVFDGGLHVPAFLHWPAGVSARRLSQPVQSMDLLPTALSAAGISLPSGMDGASLLPVLRDNAPSPHRDLFWTNQGQIAVRRGAFKLVINGREFGRSPEGNKPLGGDDALFLSNLEEDPGESRNLRRLHPGLVDELSTLAHGWYKSQPAAPAQ